MDTFDNNDITENSDNTDITENTDNMEYIESTEEPEDPVSDPGDADSGDGKSADLKNGMIREILSWVEIIVAAFLLSMFVTKVILINATVPSGSMEHLIQPGDRLFGYRLSYVFSEPERFDVVIFKYPVDESENYIKRIIGLPGEHVEIDNGKIYINGSDKPLKEDYLPKSGNTIMTAMNTMFRKDATFVSEITVISPWMPDSGQRRRMMQGLRRRLRKPGITPL